MKILKQKSKAKRSVLLLVSILLIAGIFYGVFARFTGNWPFTTPPSNKTNGQDINYSPPTNDQKTEGERIKERSVDQSNNETATPPTANQKKNTPITITAANQNNGKFQVRFLIQSLDEGTCVLRLTKDSDSVTKTSPTQALPSSTTCQGFDIPLTELSRGEWVYTMTFTGKSYTGSVSNKVTIQ